MPSVHIVRSRHDVQLADRLRVDLAFRQWSVDIGSFNVDGRVPGRLPDDESTDRLVVAIVPYDERGLSDCLSWVTAAIAIGQRPILICPESLELPGDLSMDAGGVVYRGSLSYDQVFEELFRLLLGVMPSWLDISVRPSLVQSPASVAWWSDDLFVADDRYDHVVRISPGDTTVVIPGLIEPTQVAVEGRHLVVANKTADEILSCEIVDNMAFNVESIQELEGMALRSPQGAVATDQGSAVSDTDNHRVLYSPARSHRWMQLEPALPFLRPSGLCIDENGVWVADTGNHRVVKFDLRGTEQLAVELTRSGADSALPVSVQSWRDLLFVADEARGRIEAFAIVHSGEAGLSLEPLIDRVAVDWIRQPSAISINRNNRMAVADRRQKCIWMIDLESLLPAA